MAKFPQGLVFNLPYTFARDREVLADALGDRQPVKLGYVSPQSGALSGFGGADSFVIEGVRAAFRNGLEIGGRAHPVEILVRDSQSSPTRAGELARDLIARDQVTLMLVSSTPETTNPVADACEEAAMPCISTVTPYQSWYLARRPAPDPGARKPYRWTWHFFWGLEDVIDVFSDMWSQVETNQVLGGLWPDDSDGRAWSVGFPNVLRNQGYRIVSPGRYRRQQDSFTTEIDAFEAAGAQIITGVPLPGDFANFWRQAGRRGYRPRIASIGKAMTAVALLREQEAGRIEIDDPVHDHLPWLPLATPFGPITVAHLLAHTAGIVAGMEGSPSPSVVPSSWTPTGRPRSGGCSRAAPADAASAAVSARGACRTGACGWWSARRGTGRAVRRR